MATTTQKQQIFEEKAGMELVSNHSFNESDSNVWLLRIVKFKGSGKKSWIMWCERNGVEVSGTRKNGNNITKNIREIFKI